jgi:hypothetical protein
MISDGSLEILAKRTAPVKKSNYGGIRILVWITQAVWMDKSISCINKEPASLHQKKGNALNHNN